ncbi:site-2 protease family protein [Candidatus Dependentiae bacterium]|nr:site-2 protease family protein [Candidatus Dependentiae bacterium]
MQALSSIGTLIHLILENIPLVILAILGISFLIVFHEFGHLMFAKLFNVYAPSFSIGFGPHLLKKKIGETTYALSAIPLGGYVEMAGATEEAPEGAPHDTTLPIERTFNAKPYWQKLLIMFGGILFNLLLAYIILSLLYMAGTPCIGSACDNEQASIGAVHPGTPAEKAHLQAGDLIVGVQDKKTPSIKTLLEELKPFIGKPVALEVLRKGVPQKIELTSESQGEGAQAKPRLGVTWNIEKKDFAQAFKSGFTTTKALTLQTMGVFKNIGKSKGSEFGGPLMLICQVTQFAGLGFKMFLFILAFISINLAVFNLLPFPIFDGGQILFVTIEALTGRPLSEKARESIHYYTWIAVIVLVVLLTGKDLLRLCGR